MPEEVIRFSDLPIKKLFQDFYVIPEYQREYVWGEKEVNQLMDDLYQSFQDNPSSQYFLGSLVVCKARSTHKYEVIDGQQRLITLSLLLNNLRRAYIGAGEDPSPIQRYLYDSSITETGETVDSQVIEVQYRGQEILGDLYKAKDDEEIEYSSTVEGLPAETIYNAHITIDDYLETNLKPSSNFEVVKRFLGYLLNQVILIEIQTPDIGNALKIFETINERGVGLDQVDLLKNLLFMQVGREDFQRLKNDWDKFKKSIVGDKVKEKPFRFLRYFIMANYDTGKDSKGYRIIREDDIYQWFTDNEEKCGYRADSFGFVRRIQENAEFYMNLVQNRYRNEDNVNLKNIRYLVGQAFKQHLILLLSAQKLRPELFDHLLKQLEVLLFYYNVTKEPARDIERRFANWANEIREIRSARNLNDFIESRIKTDIENRASAFRSAFLDLSFNTLQKYKIKYILGKLSAYVDQTRLGDIELDLSPYLKASIQIEHILPDTPTEDIIMSFSGGDEKEYGRYKQKLGNLTLLERAINTSIKRDFFADKKSAYRKSTIYLTRSIAGFEEVGTDTSINRINQHLRSFPEWNKDSIDIRHEMLYETAGLIWKIIPFPG